MLVNKCNSDIQLERKALALPVGISMRLVTLVRLLVTLAVFFSGAGCSLRNVHVKVEAGDCLNPPDRYCDEDGSNSILLQYQIYQLRTWVDVETLDWTAFLSDGPDVEAVKGVLSDPEDVLQVRRRFTVTAGAETALKFRRKLRTTHLLVVATGRDHSETSMLVVTSPLLRREQTLCFEYYGVFVPARRGLPCPFTFTATVPDSQQTVPSDLFREVVP